MVFQTLKKKILCLGLATVMAATPSAVIPQQAAEVQAASVDMTNVKLNKTSATIVLPTVGKGVYYAPEMYYTTGLTFSGSTHTFSISADSAHISTSNSNSAVPVSYSLSNNKLTLSATNVGTTKFTIKLYGKSFPITLHVVKAQPYPKSSSKCYYQGKIKQFYFNVQTKAGGAYAPVKSGATWKSDNEKVVTVDEKTGVVTSVYPGNALVTGKYGKITWHWIISVTKTKKVKAVEKGLTLAKGTYSQALRMNTGYYDCSSLVWRSYAPQGFNFGTASYAPTAADEAKYLVNHKGRVSGGISNTNIQNRKLRAGDLLFRTGSSNGRYKGIYHVEMIRGYVITDVKGPGDVTYTIRYVNRKNGYAVGESNQMVGRPLFD